MARPREFDTEQVREALKQAFWTHGFDGISYGALTEATGLHKASLYAAFGDKRALWMEALKAYNELEVDGAVTLLEQGNDEIPVQSSNRPASDAPLNGAMRICYLFDRVIEAVAQHNDRRGCLLCNAAVEQAPKDKDTNDHVSKGLEKMQGGFLSALRDEPGLSKMPEELLSMRASTLTSIYFGLRVMAKSGVPIEMMEAAAQGAHDLLTP